ncbi:uncharacterized protein LOC131949141 [Physella acuta]|uniref:uncharacterized protein LOC131949141 n=1 Tax=Physella acuta TaxID=109671 RepID=UPI0027DE9D3B|nr:uncharacterized protein LOC131949141 [Physella acuta]
MALPRSEWEKLRSWSQQMTDGYDHVKINNFTTSWRNGLAFCALIHRFRPELIDYHSLTPENVFQNCKLAFETAEKHLKIPIFLNVEDMARLKVPDKLSIVTYVSEYYTVLHPLPQNGGPDVRAFNPAIEVKGNNSSATASTNKYTGKFGETCVLCKSKVYLLERHIVEGKLYHRTCYNFSDMSKASLVYKICTPKLARAHKVNIEAAQQAAMAGADVTAGQETGQNAMAGSNVTAGLGTENNTISESEVTVVPGTEQNVIAGSDVCVEPDRENGEGLIQSEPESLTADVVSVPTDGVSVPANGAVLGTDVEDPNQSQSLTDAKASGDECDSSMVGTENSRAAQQSERDGTADVDCKPTDKTASEGNQLLVLESTSQHNDVTEHNYTNCDTVLVNKDNTNNCQKPEEDVQNVEMLKPQLSIPMDIEESIEKHGLTTFDNININEQLLKLDILSEEKPTKERSDEATATRETSDSDKQADDDVFITDGSSISERTDMCVFLETSSAASLGYEPVNTGEAKLSMDKQKSLPEPANLEKIYEEIGAQASKQTVIPDSDQLKSRNLEQELVANSEKFAALEKRGRELEESMVNMGDNSDDQLLGEWIQLVSEKNKLVREEAEIIDLLAYKTLEYNQETIDSKIQTCLSISDNFDDVDSLINEKIKVVEQRSQIVEKIDEDRLRYEMEDQILKAKLMEENKAKLPVNKKIKKKILKKFRK